jgi:hypothetical protein
MAECLIAVRETAANVLWQISRKLLTQKEIEGIHFQEHPDPHSLRLFLYSLRQQ